MSKRCQLTDTGVQSGNNVSHSNRKTRRRFVPNITKSTLRSDALATNFNLKITVATLRSVDHNGGLDNFLLGTTANKLSEFGQKIRRKVKKKLAASSDAKKSTGKTEAA